MAFCTSLHYHGGFLSFIHLRNISLCISCFSHCGIRVKTLFNIRTHTYVSNNAILVDDNLPSQYKTRN